MNIIVKFLKSVLNYTAIVILLAFLLAYDTFCLMWLWKWYGVPAGLPNLGFLQLMGVNLLVGLLTAHASSMDMDVGKLFKFMIITPAVALVSGFILHLFM